MPVFRWGNPLHAFPDLEREMDRWLRSMDLAIEGLRLGRPYPSLNVFTTDTSYLITAELPGCNPDELEIQVANGQLKLRGVRSLQGEIPAEKFRRSERPSGPWERTISLPERVDEQQIQAEFTNGLLKLHVPKLPTAAPRQIKVKDVSSPASSSPASSSPASSSPASEDSKPAE